MTSLSHTGQLLQVLSDPTRTRLLSVLEEEELTVVELTSILEIGQSRISTHLKRLKEAALVNDRRSGTSSFYRMASQLPPAAKELWGVLRAQLDDPLVLRDQTRTKEHLENRSDRWPESLAGQMERHYSPGRTWQSLAHSFVRMAAPGRVLDAGCGDGTVAALLAPQAADISCIDASAKMVTAARERCKAFSNVTVTQGDFCSLPFEGASFDQVLLLNVLCFDSRPLTVLREAFRVLRPKGRLVVTTLLEHQQKEIAAQYGHQILGFRTDGLRRRLRETGFQVDFCAVTSKERRKPHFRVISASALRPDPTSLKIENQDIRAKSARE